MTELKRIKASPDSDLVLEVIYGENRDSEENTQERLSECTVEDLGDGRFNLTYRPYQKRADRQILVPSENTGASRAIVMKGNASPAWFDSWFPNRNDPEQDDEPVKGPRVLPGEGDGVNKGGTKSTTRKRVSDKPVQAEVLTDMTEAEAREITAQIRGHLEDTWELLKQAYDRRAWIALSYDTWDEYCDGEFGTSRLRLPREERQQVVCSLRDAGFSIRAIASGVGIDAKTVQTDLKAGVGNSHTSTPTKGEDGKTYPRPKPKPDVPKPKPDTPAPAPVDEAMALWDSIPGNQRDKVRASVTRLVEREAKRLRREADAEIRKIQAKYFTLTMNAASEAEAQLRKDRAALSKGIWTKAEFDLIRSCLHPDSRLSVSDEKLAKAFRLFSEAETLVEKAQP